MALYQKSVLKKYLNQLETSKIEKAYNKYANHFLNPIIQENIRNSKEEQYQEGFLRDLFVKILGYTLNPDADFNLTTEYKNVKDSKKADGAILFDGKVSAVIELKGTETTDLGKVESQAFGYKNNQPDCKYIITSNFEKIRFYIDNAIEHVEFNLFTLTEADFELLYLLLAFENLSNGLAKRIKDESINQENVITKKLYQDYSIFKRELHQNLVLQNPNYEPLELFKKSQKLIDRFLFLFFAEDRQLLPPNSVRLILNDWRDLQERDVEIPLYDRFKKYFGYLNTGYKGKRYDVYAYNGGLFKPDEVLDSVTINDELLYKHALQLSAFDFASEVDVNILGHIFENSLNELDELKAELEGVEIDKSKTKRKKDGVFYTPKYITKYIVDNTVGTLCNEKKGALQLVEEDYIIDKKRQKKTMQALVEKLNEYRKWLLQLTICDPACGSGAFLNQALDFLITEHKYIDELQAKLFGDAIVMSDVEKSILENNLFGVDLNEESVEIAKLSLWLRTAQPNRKLNDLNNNIKCGNSLIDDPQIAGDKAFNWQTAFPQVFAKGGFDVVIGNPPYVNARNMKELDRKYLSSIYKELTGAWDLYVPFLLLGENICKSNIYGWIIPNKLLINDYGISTLKRLKNNNLNQVINISSLPIFENVGVYPIILINNNDNDSFNEYEIKSIDDFSNIKNCLKTKNIFKRFKLIKDYNILINSGTTGFEAQKIKPLINENFEGIEFAVSGNVDPYSISRERVPYMKDTYSFPSIRKDRNIVANSKIEFWEKPKIVIAGMTKRIEAYYTNKPLALGVGIYGIYDFANFHPLYILSILNSKFLTYYLNIEFKDKHLAGGYLAINKSTIEALPLLLSSDENQQPFIEKANLMLNLNKELQEQSQKFQRNLQREFDLDILPKKLQDWYTLNYADFLKELKKKKVELSLSQKAEWEEYFTTEAKKVLALKIQIDTTDKAIDVMVYELYGLSEEEIEIVENN
jgi:hypothetical protein